MTVRLAHKLPDIFFRRNPKTGHKMFFSPRNERGNRQLISEDTYANYMRNATDHNIVVNSLVGKKSQKMGTFVSEKDYVRERKKFEKEKSKSPSLETTFELFSNTLKNPMKGEKPFRRVKGKGFRIDKTTGFVKSVNAEMASIGNIRALTLMEKKQRKGRDRAESREEKMKFEQLRHWVSETRFRIVQKFYAKNKIDLMDDGSKWFTDKKGNRTRIL